MDHFRKTMSEPSERSDDSPAPGSRSRSRSGSGSGDDESRDKGSGEGGGGGDHPPPRKRQRVRLSCMECRRRKLSCDREFPCSRCLQSGTPERCEYETRPGLAPPNKLGLSQNALAGFDAGRLSLPGGLGGGAVLLGGGGDFSHLRKDLSRDQDRVRRLELEVAQLKNLLLTGKQVSLDGSTLNGQSPSASASASASTQKNDASKLDPEPAILAPYFEAIDKSKSNYKEEIRFFRGKEFKTRYYGPHNACLAFAELSGLCPFMKETAEEWLRPLQLAHDVKNRHKDKQDRQKKFEEPDPALEALLPSREETDALVHVYLDQFEQINRIVHIPSFRRQYAKFWEPGSTRSAAMTALVLAMISVSSCLDEHAPARFERMVSSAHMCALERIRAVDEWQQRQSQKHRRLIHYQVSCLVYLAMRVNTMKKKRFWKNSGALTQDAISVGLHRDPDHMGDRVSVFNQEMRRRIWATMQNFDMQASFDHGLPTILATLHSDANAPRNIDDDDFDEDTDELPPSRPIEQYTFSSYQHLSRHSLPLRLELSRVLTGTPDKLEYEQVIRYTNEITQEIDALPSWDIDCCGPSSSQADGVNGTEEGDGADGGDGIDGMDGGEGGGSERERERERERRRRRRYHGVAKKPLLAYTLLHIQLRQYIIPLHLPYLRLRRTNSKYQYSELIYYNAARDMVLLNDKLAQQGVRTLNFLREDNLTLAINLVGVTMLQPRGSTNMIMIHSQHTLQLLEKCLSLKEDRILRCGNNEPWGYSIMCAAVGLLEAHLGVKTTEAAKAKAAERFVNMHRRLAANSGQEFTPGQQQQQQTQQQQLQQQQQQQQQLQMNTADATGNPANGILSSGSGSSAYTGPPSSEAFMGAKAAIPFSSQGSTAQNATQAPATATADMIPGTPMWLLNPDAVSAAAGVMAPQSLPLSSGSTASAAYLPLFAPPPSANQADLAFASAAQSLQGLGSDAALEMLGVNLGDLWGADSWDLGWGQL